MKRMKYFAMMAMVVAFVACKGNSSDEPTPAPNPDQTPDPTPTSEVVEYTAQFMAPFNVFTGVYEGGVSQFVTYAYSTDYAYDQATKSVTKGARFVLLNMADTARLSVPSAGRYTAAATYEKQTFVCYVYDTEGTDSIKSGTLVVSDGDRRNLEHTFVIEGETGNGRQMKITISGQCFYLADESGAVRRAANEITTPVALDLSSPTGTALINMGKFYNDSVQFRLYAMADNYKLYVDINTVTIDETARTIAPGQYDIISSFTTPGTIIGLGLADDTHGDVRFGSYVEQTLYDDINVYFYARKGSVTVSVEGTGDEAVYKLVGALTSAFGTSINFNYSVPAADFYLLEELGGNQAPAVKGVKNVAVAPAASLKRIEDLKVPCVVDMSKVKKF